MVPFNTSEYKPRLAKFAGDYKISKIDIDGVDITSLYGQLDVYESLVGPIYATLSVTDTNGIIYGNYPAASPILGGEVVTVVVDDTEYKFKVYGVTDRAMVNPTTMYFVLLLVSEDGFVNHHSSLSHSFISMKHHDMVRRIYERHMGGRRDLIVHCETEAKENYVSPNIPPLAAISRISYYSVSSERRYSRGPYVFFETKNGWHYVPYELLLDEQANKSFCKMSVDTIRTTGKSALVSYDDRTEEDYITIDSYKFTSVVETKKHADFGVYAASATFADMSVKKMPSDAIRYVDNYYDTMHSPYAPSPVANDAHIGDMMCDVQTRWDVITEHAGLFSEDRPNRSRPSNWFLARRSLVEQASMFNMEVTIGMVRELTAGMAVDIRLPKISAEDMRLGRSDDKYSGRFVITSLRRTYKNNTNAFITMSVMKDGLDGNIPFMV